MARRLVLLSGPSCVGKGPLFAAVQQFHGELGHEAVPVIKAKESRGGKPRPDDRPVWDDPDYWRPAAEIIALKGNPRYSLATAGASLRRSISKRSRMPGGLRWLRQAEDDLSDAEYSLAGGRNSLACFLCTGAGPRRALAVAEEVIRVVRAKLGGSGIGGAN